MKYAAFLHLRRGVDNTYGNRKKHPKKTENYLLLGGLKGGKNDQIMTFFIKTENTIFHCICVSCIREIYKIIFFLEYG